jgi:hypothetical protein
MPIWKRVLVAAGVVLLLISAPVFWFAVSSTTQGNFFYQARVDCKGYEVAAKPGRLGINKLLFYWEFDILEANVKIPGANNAKGKDEWKGRQSVVFQPRVTFSLANLPMGVWISLYTIYPQVRLERPQC